MDEPSWEELKKSNLYDYYYGTDSHEKSDKGSTPEKIGTEPSTAPTTKEGESGETTAETEVSNSNTLYTETPTDKAVSEYNAWSDWLSKEAKGLLSFDQQIPKTTPRTAPGDGTTSNIESNGDTSEPPSGSTSSDYSSDDFYDLKPQTIRINKKRNIVNRFQRNRIIASK